MLRSDMVGLIFAAVAISYAVGAYGLPRGVYVSVSGVENLNLTLIAKGNAATETASGQVCSVAGVPEPFEYYPTDDASPEEGTSDLDAIAYIYVSVTLGGVATVTFYGGESTNETFVPPFITTVDGSSDSGTATGPLYVTKRAVSSAQEALDLAEFFPTSSEQVGYIAGGLSNIGAPTAACNYNISFTTAPTPAG